MVQFDSSINRRRFLRRAVGGSVGLGLLGQHAELSATSQAKQAPRQDDWPQYQFDAGNAGYNPQGRAPARQLTLDWQKAVDGLDGALAVAEQTVYAPIYTDVPGKETPARNTLLALDAADGSTKWRAPMGDEGSVAVVDGTIYLADVGTRALDAADGSELWSTPHGSYYPFVTDRFVYVTEGVEACLALDRTDGSIRWESNFRATQILAVNNDTVYVGAEDGMVRALAATTGNRRWAQSLDDTNPELAAANGMAYAAAVRGFYALDGASGDVKWTIPSQRTPDTSYRENVSLPVIGDETVYVAVDGILHAVTADTGTEQWTYEYASPEHTAIMPPARVGDVIYAVDAPNRVVTLDAATGKRLGVYTVPFDGLDWAVVPAGGAVYVGGDAYNGEQSGLFKLGGEPVSPAPTATQTPTRTDIQTSTGTPTPTRSQTKTPTGSPTTSAVPTDGPTTTVASSPPATTTTAPSTETKTGTRMTQPTTEQTTATDGPGFGVLAALGGIGLYGWRSLTRE
jgi:outer membrane protein assembly factor BamB